MRLNAWRFLVIFSVFLTGCTQAQVSDIRVKASGSMPIEMTVDKVEKSPTAYFAYVTPATKRLLLIEDFLKAYVAKEKMETKFAYLYNFADLNQDGENEILISLLKSGEKKGSRRLIVAGDYKTLLGELDCSGPLIVTDKKAGEWLILATYAGDGQYKIANFENNHYQFKPISKENVIQYTEISGSAYLSDEDLFAGFSIM